MTEVVEIAGGSTIVVEDNTVTIIEVGTQGPAGPPGVGLTEIDFGTLTASTTATVDSIAVSERCAKWLICAFDTATPKTQTWTVEACNDGTSADFTVFAKTRVPLVGGPLKIDTIVDVSGGAMRLRLTNNESFGISISVLRMSVSP